MPRTLISETTVALGGSINDITFTAADATNDHRFVPKKNQIMLMKNTGASPAVFTFNMVADRAGRTSTEVVTVPITTGLGMMGPFPETYFKQTGGTDAGFVTVDLDQDTGVTVALIELRET
jgi:hypothetical protein